MNLKRNNKLVNLLLIFALAISILAFFIDLKNTIIYWGTDLRNRVVGTRLALAGIEPYFFMWHQGLSDRFLDPLDTPGSLISRLTVPPTVLTLHSIIAKLAYLPQKIIWLIFQWVLLLGTVFIFVKKSNSQTNTNLVLAVGFFLSIVSSGAFMLIQDKYIFFT